MTSTLAHLVKGTYYMTTTPFHLPPPPPKFLSVLIPITTINLTEQAISYQCWTFTYHYYYSVPPYNFEEDCTVNLDVVAHSNRLIHEKIKLDHTLLIQLNKVLLRMLQLNFSNASNTDICSSFFWVRPLIVSALSTTSLIQVLNY